MTKVFVIVENLINEDQLFQGEFSSDPLSLKDGDVIQLDMLTFEVIKREVYIDRGIVFITYYVNGGEN